MYLFLFALMHSLWGFKCDFPGPLIIETSEIISSNSFILINLVGIMSVEVNKNQSRLTVTGYVDAKKVLKRVKEGTGKAAMLWPYVPHNLVYYPYAANIYNKKAPPGYVRKVEYPLSTPNRADETYTTLFSDDNTSACAIM